MSVLSLCELWLMLGWRRKVSAEVLRDILKGRSTVCARSSPEVKVYKLIRLGVMAPLTNENRAKQLCVKSIVTTLIWTLNNHVMVTTRKVHIHWLTRRWWWWRWPLPRRIRGRGWERRYKLLRWRLVAVDKRASLWLRGEPFSARKNKLVVM